MKNLLKTCQGPPSQRRYCTSPHGRHAFGHFTKTILRICQKNAGAPPSQCRHCTSPGSRNSLAFQTSHFVREFSRQVPGSHDRDADFKRAILSENLQENVGGSIRRHYTSPRGRNALGHSKTAILRENLHEKCRGIDTQTLHEPAQSQCIGTLQKSNLC